MSCVIFALVVAKLTLRRDLLCCPTGHPSQSQLAIPVHADDRTSPMAIWFTAKDREIANMRLERYKRVSPDPISWACAKRTARNPLTYAMCFIYCACLFGVSGILCEWRLLPAGRDS